MIIPTIVKTLLAVGQLPQSLVPTYTSVTLASFRNHEFMLHALNQRNA